MPPNHEMLQRIRRMQMKDGAQPSASAADQTSQIPQNIGTLRQRLLSQFHVAFSLMSIIPLLLCCYLITVKFFSLSILQGLNGVYFLLAVAFAILGLIVGQLLIRGVIRQLVATNRKLEEFHQMQATFVSNVAHELRAPLTVVKGALDNLADGLHGTVSADQMEPIAMSQREINRLKRLVGDLLDVARIEAGKMRLVREEVNLQECLSAVAKSFDGMLKQRGLSVALEMPPPPVRVTGDQDRLSQVFINLVVNSIKFTKQGGIRLRLLNETDEVQIEVVDTGRGIPEEDLERIFDKFELVGSDDQEGSGLGLPIAKAIVELHYGRIWAESQLGRGSRFIVRLPHSQPN